MVSTNWFKINLEKAIFIFFKHFSKNLYKTRTLRFRLNVVSFLFFLQISQLILGSNRPVILIYKLFVSIIDCIIILSLYNKKKIENTQYNSRTQKPKSPLWRIRTTMCLISSRNCFLYRLTKKITTSHYSNKSINVRITRPIYIIYIKGRRILLLLNTFYTKKMIF